MYISSGYRRVPPHRPGSGDVCGYATVSLSADSFFTTAISCCMSSATIKTSSSFRRLLSFLTPTWSLSRSSIDSAFLVIFSGAFLHSVYEGPQLSRTHPTTPLCSPNEHEGCSSTPTATMPSPHTPNEREGCSSTHHPPNMPLCSPNELEGCLSTPCTPPHPSAIPTSRE
jgi:hypothetical protein